jgi:hypothetical protein
MTRFQFAHGRGKSNGCSLTFVITFIGVLAIVGQTALAWIEHGRQPSWQRIAWAALLLPICYCAIYLLGFLSAWREYDPSRHPVDDSN